MKDTELVSALRQLKVNTKSLACMGCGYEQGCSIHGCRLIGLAADRLNKVGIILSIIKGMHAEAKGSDRQLLGIVLALFDRWYGQPKNTAPVYFTDFELCADTKELGQTLTFIDNHGYSLVSATQDSSGTYTVFFRRPAQE